jgi:hypothetical protein
MRDYKVVGWKEGKSIDAMYYDVTNVVSLVNEAYYKGLGVGLSWFVIYEWDDNNNVIGKEVCLFRY